MSFSQPSSPDPTAVANTQQGYNFQAAQVQNQNNSYNQSNPYGSLSYTSDPNSPSGYSVNTSLSAPQQALLDQRQQNQGILGASAGTNANTANTLAQNSAGMYSSPFDLNAATGQTASLLNNWNQQYLQPIFNQQQSNTNAQLQNQGLAPGSQAYNNAQNLLARNQGDVTNQYLSQNEGQAFNQALQNYGLPLQTEQGLLSNSAGALGASAPQALSFQSTPTATIQPANYESAAQNNFTNQQGQFQNTMQGVGQLAGGFANMAGMFLL